MLHWDYPELDGNPGRMIFAELRRFLLSGCQTIATSLTGAIGNIITIQTRQFLPDCQRQLRQNPGL